MLSITDSLIEPLASSLINAITGKGIMKGGEEQESGFLSLAPFLNSIAWMEVTRAGTGYTVDSLIKGLTKKRTLVINGQILFFCHKSKSLDSKR